MQQTTSFIRINAPRKQLLPDPCQFLQPFPVFRSKLNFQLTPDPLGESRTVAVGRDGKLKISSSYDRGIVEVAVFRIINNVAQDIPSLCLEKNSFVHLARRRGCDDQENTVKIRGVELARFPRNRPGLHPPSHSGCYARCNDADRSTRIQQTANLGLADCARAHHKAGSALEFQKHWKQAHLLSFNRMWHPSWRRIPRHRRQEFTCKAFTQLHVAMPRKKASQIFAG